MIGQVYLRYFCEKKDKMGVRPTISDLVDCIDYVANLAGVDHVGLGSDHSPTLGAHGFATWWWQQGGDVMCAPHKLHPVWEERYPVGLETMADMVKIADELLERGYSDDDTKKILGGNWLRLLKEVEK